jgi:hypothetical protein
MELAFKSINHKVKSLINVNILGRNRVASAKCFPTKLHKSKLC